MTNIKFIIIVYEDGKAEVITNIAKKEEVPERTTKKESTKEFWDIVKKLKNLKGKIFASQLGDIKVVRKAVNYVNKRYGKKLAIRKYEDDYIIEETEDKIESALSKNLQKQ